MSLDDLFKKQKELSVLEKDAYSYNDDQIKKATKVLHYLAQSIYSACAVAGWLKLQSLLKLLLNFINFTSMTPFYHSGTALCTHFALISLCCIQMLESIRKNSFNEFKHRYDRKIMNTEQATIHAKLQLGACPHEPLIEAYRSSYYRPELDSSTTKSYWFSQELDLDMEAISAMISYTVNSLRVEGKFNLVISIVRGFSNATQHCYSLELLPFMINSQLKLQEEVEEMIGKESRILEEVRFEYVK